MSKIFLNTRDQLVVVNPDLIAAVQADGNYSRVLYCNRREIILTVGISKLEKILKSNGGKKNSFIRLGRSIIINHKFLFKIDIPTQQIILSDGSTQELRLNLSKKLLKPYKEATVQSVLTKNEYGKENNTGN
ncbi:MAG: LytTR family transcriptional regulator [Prevotella sp.]|nr:LytTR family transcriptional regulator [Prevotella sp.]